jgi:hypothetical protein
VDQLYFEEGYLEASYFTVIREAEASLPMAVTVSAQGDIADATGYYIPDYIVTDYFVSGGQLLEAEAALSVFVTQTASVERIIQAAANVNVTISKSCTVTRFTQSAVTLNVAAANTCTVTRIIDNAAAFTAAFAPTLTAIAFKNHTAVMDSVSTMSVDAVANRSANVLLEHIADLNAMAAKTVDVISTASTTATQSTAATKTASPSINLSSSAAIVCTLDKLQLASSELILRSSLTTSRYAGFGRPRNVKVVTTPTTVNDMLSTTYQKFGTYSLTYHNNGVNTVSQFEAVNDLDLPAPNESWVYEAWFYFESAYNNSANAITLGLGTKDGSGSYFFYWEGKPDTTNSVQLRKTGYSTTTTGSRTMSRNSWQHLLLVYHNGIASSYINGNRNTSVNLSAFTSASWLAQSPNITINLRQYSYVDAVSFHQGTNLGYDPTQTTITVPTTLRTNNVDSTQLLWNFEGNGNDSIAVTLTGSATLTSSCSLTAQANANTKLASADLTALATVSAQGDKPASATANLVTVSTLSVVIGSVKDSITLNAGAFTVTTQETRLRDAASSITSAFAPTLTATVTRGGDITLASVFAMSTDATSFTDSTANISAAFSITASADTIIRQGVAAVSSEFNQTTTIGRLQSVSVPITSAFTTVMNVAYFEGTSLIAPMAAVMSVTAVKTARITQTLSVVASVSAVVNENPQAPPANPITATFQERVDVNVAYTYTYVRSSSTRRSFNFTSDTAVPGGQVGIGALEAGSLFPDGSLGSNSASASAQMYVYVYGNAGGGDYYDVYVYSYDLGVVDSINIGASAQGNGSGSIRLLFDAATTGLLTAYLDGSSTPISLAAPTTTFKSRINYPTFQPFGIPNTNGMFGWPPILFPTVNNVRTVSGNTNLVLTSASVTDDAYNLYYGPQEYGQADLIDINFATLTAEPFSVQFGQASAQVLTAITADVRRIRQGVLNLASTVTTAINAGKNVEIGSDLASQSTLTASALKVARVEADLNVVTAQSTVNDRLRTSTVTLASAVSASIAPVKRIGVVVNAESAVSQTVTAFRIQQGQASISALYSQLSVAFQNATGTVLLETVTTMQITAEKNAVGVIQLASAFTQSTNSADSKTARVSSAMAAEFTQVSEGLRIQPAGADVSAQFTQTTNSDLSKTTRVTANVATAVAITATARRLRSTPTTMSAVASVVCNNIVLRRASANLTDSFDILISVQYIIRVTATFSAFNSQLTVGEIINIDPFLQLKIEPETRINKIPQESRVFIIESETRVNIIKD